jgi:Short C-terminal domain
MMMRPMVVRRRPLLRAAAIGGTFAAGRAMGRRAEAQNSADQNQDQASQGQASQGQASQGQQAPPQGQAPTDAGGAGGGPSMTDQLNQLASMHDQGALSDEEFAAAKAKLLGGQTSTQG